MKKSLFTLGFLIWIVSIGSMAATVNAVSVPNKPIFEDEASIDLPDDDIDFDDIVFIADPNYDDFKPIIDRLDEILTYVYEKPRIAWVSSSDELINTMDRSSMAVVYFLNTSLEGVQVGNDTVSWNEFSKALIRSDLTSHVLGIGDTVKLNDVIQNVPSNLYYDGGDVLDIDLAFFYDLWTLSDIVGSKASIEAYNKSSIAMKQVALQFWSDNFNVLISRAFDPVNPTGELDYQKRLEKINYVRKEKFPEVCTKEYPTEMIDGVEVPVEPAIDLKSFADVNSTTDILLSFLPDTSGLQGPMGNIVDLLLNLLLETGYDALSIPKDLGDKIIKGIKQVYDLIGIFKKDTTSGLKALLSTVAKDFPFPEEYKKYFDLFTNALFALRGDYNDIMDVITSAVDTLWPSSLPESIKNIVMQVINITEGVKNTIDNYDSIYKALAAYLSKNLTKDLIYDFLNDTLGVDAAKIEEYVRTGKAYFDMIIDFVLNFNVTDFAYKLGSELLSMAYNYVDSTIGKQIGMKISAIVRFALSIAGITQEKIKDTIEYLLSQYIPVTELKDQVNGLRKLAENISETFKNFYDGVITDIDVVSSRLDTAIKASINTIPYVGVNGNMQVLAVNQDIITSLEKAILLGIAAYKGNVDTSKIPKLGQDIIKPILNEFGLNTTIINSITEKVSLAVNFTLGIYAELKNKDQLKQFIAGTKQNFKNQLGDIKSMIRKVLEEFIPSDKISPYADKINEFIDIAQTMINLYKENADQSITAILQTLLQTVGFSYFKKFTGIDISAYYQVMKGLFGKWMGLAQSEIPTTQQVLTTLENILTSNGINSTLINQVKTLVNVLMDVKDIFTQGVNWIIGQIMDWISGQAEKIINDLIDELDNELKGIPILNFHNKFDVGLGSLSAFYLEVGLELNPEIKFNEEAFSSFLKEIVLDGNSILEKMEFTTIFKKMTSFFNFVPVFSADLGIGGFDSTQENIFSTLLDTLGVELSFSGSGHFNMELMSFVGGDLQVDNFFKVVEWGFSFTIKVSRDITLIDILSGGTGGVLNKAAKYIGLDLVVLTISFAVQLTIVKKAASLSGPEVSSISVVLTLGFALSVGFSLLVVSLKIYGSMEISLSFYQELGTGKPLQILFNIVLYFKITLDFTLSSTSYSKHYYPVGKDGIDISPNPGSPEMQQNGMGLDADMDGLSDSYEAMVPGLLPNTNDSDGDGLADKYETQVLNTDPSKKDTDGDGLDDNVELDIGTNPLLNDTDFDSISDYDEYMIYKTNPLEMDSDSDGYTDYFEIFHVWDTSGVTISVPRVLIGGVWYANHTDPLNPDTDNDGLLDGEEGPTGAYYGLDDLYNESDSSVDDTVLIFNGGYTHPLDNDTDDDSYAQIYNGVAIKTMFLRSMTDGEEVHGIRVTFIINRTPVEKLVKTNPCNPDTDGDTGITAAQRDNPPATEFINSDGYELSLNPPSDPLDGDTDDDGLIDGLEGTLRSDSNHTYYLDPDTDGDGLYDGTDMLIGTDPRNPDTDNDMVTDGQEYNIFHTDPTLPDTDHDGLLDGEELFLFHTNPFIVDSDGDGLSDSQEVLRYGTDPMDEDTDNDNLTDWEELFFFMTLPMNNDTDGDGIDDGTEVQVYFTNPLSWDTDGDSILYYNENLTITWNMSDYQEINVYNTSPTNFDSDTDGLSDGIELYLGSGLIPNMVPIPLDPMNNDTDGDGLTDGQELQITNGTTIIAPYESFWPEYMYNTSPLMADTDNDNISDYVEVVELASNPACNDTDGDGLTDWQEINVYGTDPLMVDTDGDNLTDYEEVAPVPPALFGDLIKPLFRNTMHYGTGTNATNPDTDGDMLPDGVEIYFYHKNPLVQDEDGNGKPDGLDVDTDGDGLADGLEIMVYHTQTVSSGITDQDADNDGLSDGDEVYLYHTNVTEADTDGDGYPDGLEVAIGTSPTSETNSTEYQTKVDHVIVSGGLSIIAPKTGQQVSNQITVSVANLTNIEAVWFRYYDGATWSNNISLTYNSETGIWQSDTIVLADGVYTLQVFGNVSTGGTFKSEVAFVVGAGASMSTVSVLSLVGIGIAAGFGLALFLIVFRKPLSNLFGRILPFGKGKSKGVSEEEAKSELDALTPSEKKSEEDVKESAEDKSEETAKTTKRKTRTRRTHKRTTKGGDKE